MSKIVYEWICVRLPRYKKWRLMKIPKGQIYESGVYASVGRFIEKADAKRCLEGLNGTRSLFDMLSNKV